MNFITVLQLVTLYGPTIIPLAQKLAKAISDGKGNQSVTDADWAELVQLSTQTAADIYARLGIALPPTSKP